MDEFSKLCLTTEAKINVFIKMNKLDEKVNLFEVLECMGEYKTMDENQSKTLTNIKEEIEIDIDEPNLGRFVINCVNYNNFILYQYHFQHLRLYSLYCLCFYNLDCCNHNSVAHMLSFLEDF